MAKSKLKKISKIPANSFHRAESVKDKVIRNSFMYSLLNALFSTLLFVATYYFYLNTVSGLLQLVLLFTSSVITGIIGSWIARTICHFYKNKFHDMQFITRNLFISLFYSILIFIGVITFIFESFDLIAVITILLVIKSVLFFACDFLADKFTFGG
jgi:hypothetical protein